MTRASSLWPLASLAVLLAASCASAQFMRLERWGYAHVNRLRNELLSECLELDPTVRRRVAERLAEVRGDTPFEVIADALAIAKGAEPDDLSRLRGSVTALVLPEAVDLEQYREVHVTMRAPRVVAELDDLVFTVVLRDADGEELQRRVVEGDHTVEDLLRARPTVALDVSQLPEGRYRIEVPLSIGGELPRAFDVRATGDVWILPKFKTRAEALPLLPHASADHVRRVHALEAEIAESGRDPLSRALLTGALWQVDRVYRAEPPVPGSDPVAELAAAERIYANLCEGRAALDGSTGRITVGVPADRAPGEVGEVGEVCLVTLDLPERSGANDPRPLCLVVSGAPTWTANAQRPSTPESTTPQWLRDQLDRAGFDSEQRCLVAVLESPGRFTSASRAALNASLWLRRLLPVDAERMVWIGEREGAYAVSRAALQSDVPPIGLVLVAGGMLTSDDLERLDGCRILGVPAQGHPANTALEVLARSERSAGAVRILDPDGVPWPIAIGLRAAEIEAFVRDLISD